MAVPAAADFLAVVAVGHQAAEVAAASPAAVDRPVAAALRVAGKGDVCEF